MYYAVQVLHKQNRFVGNYGRAFAYASKMLGLTKNIVLMPDAAPAHRGEAIEKMGTRVEKMPSENLMAGIKKVNHTLDNRQKGFLFFVCLNKTDNVSYV